MQYKVGIAEKCSTRVIQYRSHSSVTLSVFWSCNFTPGYNNTNDAAIIGSVIVIGHYWPLFLVSVSVISEGCNQYCIKCINLKCHFFAFMILMIIEKFLIFIEVIRNQKVNIILDRLLVHTCIWSNYKCICLSRMSVKSLISASQHKIHVQTYLIEH